MRRPPCDHVKASTRRSIKPGVSPYYVEEIAMTRVEILQARAADLRTAAPG